MTCSITPSLCGAKDVHKLAIINDFTDTMTVDTYQEQIERTLQVKDEDLIYYGIVLFGDWDKVTELPVGCNVL